MSVGWLPGIRAIDVDTARCRTHALVSGPDEISGFARIDPKPPILWVRGADDQVVSDTSFFDFGYLGQIGAVPGWPGAEIQPPQPMIGQLHAMFDPYRAGGGTVREEVFPETGHCAFIERPEAFQRLLLEHLGG